MTMTAQPRGRSDFRKHLDEFNSLPEDIVLGHVVWFSVADAAYDGAYIESEFDRLNLNPTFLPRRLNPADAFEKASKVPHGHKYDVAGDNTAEMLVRPWSRDGERIVRKLMREVKNQKQQRLLYTEVAEMVFYKPPTRNGVVDYSGANVRFTIAGDVSKSERPIVQEQLDRVQAEYEKHCRYHDGQKMRAVVRGYLGHLNAIMLKPTGGVYFVFQNRGDELRRLNEFMTKLPPETTGMTTLAQADLPALRGEVTDAFKRESVKDFQEITTQVSELLESRKSITPEMFQRVRKDFEARDEKAGEYTRTLDISHATTDAAKEAARAALMVLQEKVIAEQMRRVNG